MTYLNQSLLSLILLFFLFNSVNAQSVSQAEILKERASRLYNETNLDSAILVWQAAAQAFYESEDYEQYIHCMNEVGSTQSELGRFESALTTLKNVLKEGKKRLGSEARLVGKSLYYLASCQGYMGAYDEAISNLKLSLEIARKAGKGDRTEEAVVLNGLGRINFFLSRYDEALGYFSESLEIILNYSGDQTQILAGYTNVGTINLIKGLYSQAASQFEHALTYIPDTVENVHKAGIYNNLGYCLFEQGEFERALLYYQKSLDMRRALLEKDHPAIASSLTNVGNVHYKLGAADLALGYFDQALELRRKTLKDDHPDIGQNLMNIGMMHHSLENYSDAERYLADALEVLIAGVGENHQFTGEVCLNLGITYRKQDKLGKADSVFQKALAIFEDKESDNDKVAVYLQYAKMRSNHLLQAIDHAHQAMKVLIPGWQALDEKELFTHASTSNYHNFLKILKAMADALENVYDQTEDDQYLQDALLARKLSVQLLDKMRINYRSNVSKIFNDGLHNEIYKKGVLDAIKLTEVKNDANYEKEAFWFVENSKARVLYTNLVESRIQDNSLLDEEILKEQRIFKEELVVLENARMVNDSSDHHAITRKIFEVTRKLEFLSDYIKGLDPDYYRLTQQTEVASVEKVQQALTSDEAVLEYFVDGKDLVIVLITRENFRLTFIRNESLHSNIRGVYKAINKRNKSQFGALSRSLYDQLIQPVSNDLKGKKTLRIIPHGLLWYVPFEALATGGVDEKLSDVTYLISDFVISYHYSSTLLMEHEDRTVQRPSLLAFAPVFDRVNSKHLFRDSLRFSDFYLKANSHDYLRPLPESVIEIDQIKKLYQSKGLPVSSYLHGQSTEATFKQASRDYSILHLATHSIIDEEKPNYSGIYFSKPNSTDSLSEDGILFSGELYNLDLNSDLVVLSSCESGIGKLSRGEGMLSLSRGFYYAGARQVIYSLWKVYDKSTRDLMIRFYTYLLDDQSVANALRQAKLNMLKNKATAFPKNWAGFVLLGK